MKKMVIILLVLTLVLYGCRMGTSTESSEYIGTFEDDLLYEEILKIENCTNPEQLVSIIDDFYEEDISYIFLEYDENKTTFKEPYEDIKCNVYSLYSDSKNKGRISANFYAFFVGVNESPSFIMDNEGTYFVGNYEIETIEENNYIHYVNAWVLSDLYLCLHKYTYCKGDILRREAFSNIVKSFHKYTDLELLITNHTSDSND